MIKVIEVKMELLQLKYFCHSARNENFSKTAKEYQVPVSNISQSIHRLESELNLKLFDRTANKVKLNAQGKAFYDKVSEAITLIEDAKKQVFDKESIKGEIRILAETNRRIVVEAVTEFQSKFPDVSFFINHSPDDDYSKYDCVITDRLLNNESFDKKLLVRERILLAVEKQNKIAHLKQINQKNLENEKFITPRDNGGLYDITEEICNKLGFEPHIVIQSDDPYYIRKYVEMGMGISFIPEKSWKGLFSENVVLKDVGDKKRDTYLYTHKNRYHTMALKHFTELLISIS